MSVCVCTCLFLFIQELIVENEIVRERETRSKRSSWIENSICKIERQRSIKILSKVIIETGEVEKRIGKRKRKGKVKTSVLSKSMCLAELWELYCSCQAAVAVDIAFGEIVRDMWVWID